MVDNANLSLYGNNAKASSAAKKFNRKYTEMLTSLDNVFNGHADQIGATIGLMYTLFTELQELVQIPIDIQGDQYVGPNVGPTYDFTPHDWTSSEIINARFNVLAELKQLASFSMTAEQTSLLKKQFSFFFLNLCCVYFNSMKMSNVEGNNSLELISWELHSSLERERNFRHRLFNGPP